MPEALRGAYPSYAYILSTDPFFALSALWCHQGYGGVAAGLDYSAVDVSEATFRDVFLPPFAAGVEAGALTLMSAFVAIVGGIPVRALRLVVCFCLLGACSWSLAIIMQASGSRWLQTEVLREELGFTGFVVVRCTKMRTWNSLVYYWLFHVWTE